MKPIVIRYFIFDSLINQPIRSVLTLIGIIIGVMTVILTFGATNMLLNQSQAVISNFGSDKILILPISQQQIFSASSIAGFQSFDINDINAINGLPFVESIGYGNAKRLDVKYKNEEVKINVIAATPNIFDLFQSTFKIEQGRAFKEHETGSAVIGGKVQSLFTNEINIGSSIYISGKQYRVVGIMKASGYEANNDLSIFVNYDDSEKIQMEKNKIFLIYVDILDNYDINSAAEQIKNNLKYRKGITDDEQFSVITQDYLKSTIGNLLNSINIAALAVSAIASLVSAFGIANTMFTVITRRRREIGILRSIGATRNDIMKIFIAESLLTALVGSFIGLLLGTIIGFLLSFFQLLDFSLSINQVFIAFLLGFFVGMIGGILPAYQASKISPVVAMKL
ncbi:MAG: FtsX-like permease family protein [Candidatus Anstonellales archaeon]